MFTPEFVMQIVVMIATGGFIYGGIRADLRTLHTRVEGAEDDIAAANRRLDNHIDRSRP